MPEEEKAEKEDNVSKKDTISWKLENNGKRIEKR